MSLGRQLKALAFILLALSFLIYPTYFLFCYLLESDYATYQMERAIGRSLGMHVLINSVQCRGLTLHAASLKGFSADPSRPALRLYAKPIDCKLSFLKLLCLKFEITECRIGEATWIQPDAEKSKILRSFAESIQSRQEKMDAETPWSFKISILKIEIKKANLLWEGGTNRAGGVHHTALVILPSETGGNPDASPTMIHVRGGELRQEDWPPFQIQDAELHLQDESLEVARAALSLVDEPLEGKLRLSGRVGLTSNQPTELNLEIDKLPFRPFLPDSLQKYITGRAVGKAKIECPHGLEIETLRAHGHLKLDEGKLYALPGLNKLEKWIPTATYREMQLDRAEADWQWSGGLLQIQNLQIESNGKARLSGVMNLQNRRVEGLLNMGLPPKLVDHLPESQREVFTQEDSPYRCADIRLSGSIDDLRAGFSASVQEAVTHAIEEQATEILQKAKTFFDDFIKRASEEWQSNPK